MPAIEATFMMLQFLLPALIMRRETVLVTNHGPRTLMANTESHSFSSISRTVPLVPSQEERIHFE